MKRAHNWLLSSVEEGGNDFGRVLKQSNERLLSSVEESGNDFGRVLKQSNEIRTVPIRKNDAEKEV
jgi:hypothetical protein